MRVRESHSGLNELNRLSSQFLHRIRVCTFLLVTKWYRGWATCICKLLIFNPKVYGTYIIASDFVNDQTVRIRARILAILKNIFYIFTQSSVDRHLSLSQPHQFLVPVCTVTVQYMQQLHSGRFDVSRILRKSELITYTINYTCVCRREFI
jgi:hypothetical protein